MALTDFSLQGSGDSTLPSAPQTTPSQQPSSTQPTSNPQFSGPPANAASQQAQAAQADLNNAATQLSAQQAPTYTAPTLSGQPSFFGRLLQGALNGLAGGVEQGQQNIAGAGTPGFTPGGNGISYAQKLQAAQDQRQAEADKAKQDTAQTQFENDKAAFQMKQQQTVQQVQAAQAKLNSIHTVQGIETADQDAQDKYFAGQKAYGDAVLEIGGKEIAHMKVNPGESLKDVGAAYVKDNPGLFADPNVHLTFSKNANGDIEGHVLKGDPDARITAEDANKILKTVDPDAPPLPPDTAMSLHDFNQKYAGVGATAADRHYKAAVDERNFQQQQQLQKQTQDAEMARTRFVQGQENSRAAAKNNPISAVDGNPLANATPNAAGVRIDYLNSLPSNVQGTVRAIGEGRMAPPNPRTKEGKALSDQVTSAYPNYDATKFHAYQAAETKATSGDLSKGITAGNTAITHVAEMIDNADALSVLPGAGYAARKGVFGAKAQQQAQNFETAQNAAAEEVNKAIKGSVLGVDEGKRALADIHSWTPGEAKSKGVSLLHLLKDRLDAQQDTLNQASVTGVAPFKVVNDKAQATFNRLTGATSAQSTRPAGATHTAKGSDGKMQYTNAQGQDLGVAQ